MTTKRASGSNAQPFRLYIDRTPNGVPEQFSGCTFKLRVRAGAEVLSTAGTVPSDGVVEFWPTVEQVTLDPVVHEYRFLCVRLDGSVYKTPWHLHEITD